METKEKQIPDSIAHVVIPSIENTIVAIKEMIIII